MLRAPRPPADPVNVLVAFRRVLREVDACNQPRMVEDKHRMNSEGLGLYSMGCLNNPQVGIDLTSGNQAQGIYV